MKIYLERLITDFKKSPQQFFVGMCVFFVVVMGTSVRHVASACFGLLVLYSFYEIKSWGKTWKQLTANEKLLLGCFSLYAMSGVIAFINVQDVYEYIKMLEKYLRFLLAIPIYLLIKKYQISVINYLYAGAVVSGPFLFLVAMLAYLDNPNAPAHGSYHHIIFGSVAMLNVGVMLSILLIVKMNNIFKAIIFISMLCGLSAVMLSQARGVWLVLPLYLFVLLCFSFKHSRIKFANTIVVCVLIVSVLLLSPIGGMVKKRIDLAVNEVNSFYIENNYTSSLGTRLAMWKIAVDVWKQHPIIGTGPGDFDETILQLQENGHYVGMKVFASTHNIYMQALVNAGLVGFIIMMLALFIVPLKIIFELRKTYPVKSLTGFVFLFLFSTVGLSESWTFRMPAVTVYIVFLIVVVSNMHLTNKKSL